MRLARLAAVALAASVIGSQFAVPASAAETLRALRVVTVNSLAESASVRTVTATCTGQRLIGGGFYLDGDTQGEVLIDKVLPSASYFQVRARETPKGTKGLWWLRTYAVCADDQPGFQVVGVDGPTATCPAGKKVTGGGAEVIGGNGEVILNSMVPGVTTVNTVAVEDANGAAAAWSLRTYAVCGPGDLPGLQRVNALALGDSNNKHVASTCPSGARTLSVGWDIGNRTPGLVTPEIVVPETPPWATGSYVYARELGAGTSTTWSLGSTLVCAFA